MASQSTTLIKSKDVLTRAELADLLQSLADRLRGGRITLDQGANRVEMEVPATLHVDLELKDSVKPARTKRELEIEMWWEVDETGAPTGAAAAPGGLSVS